MTNRQQILFIPRETTTQSRHQIFIPNKLQQLLTTNNNKSPNKDMLTSQQLTTVIDNNIITINNNNKLTAQQIKITKNANRNNNVTLLSGTIVTTRNTIQTTTRKERVQHPNNNNNNNQDYNKIIINATNIINNKKDFRECMRMNALTCIWNSVEESTRTSYKTSWSRYLDFIEQFGTNAKMTLVPIDYKIEKDINNECIPYKEEIILSYLCWLRFEAERACNPFVWEMGERFGEEAKQLNTKLA